MLAFYLTIIIIMLPPLFYSQWYDPASPAGQDAAAFLLAAAMDGKAHKATKLKISAIAAPFGDTVDVLKTALTGNYADPADPAVSWYGYADTNFVQVSAKIPVPGFTFGFITYIAYQTLGQDMAAGKIAKSYYFEGSDFARVILTVPFNNENVMYVTGSVPQLGLWDAADPLKMTLGYSRGGLYWYVYIPAIVGVEIEYKGLFAPNQWVPGDNSKRTPTQEDVPTA